MTAESIGTEQYYIQREYKRTYTDAEAIGKLCCGVGVVSEDRDKNDCDVQEISVDILQNEREFFLAAILMTRLADRTRGRVGPKGLVIRTAIVITRKSKSARRPQDEKSRSDG